MREIPIFFSIDDGFAPFLSAALASAVENCSKERTYKAIILHQGVSEKNKVRLSALATDNFQIEFVEMQKGLESITNRSSNCMRFDFFTLTIYFRLFIASMFPEYDKGIYIDSDVVVLGDLAQLFDMNLGENLIGACADKSVVDVDIFARYMEQAVGINRHKYINSGVLLMNLKALREQKFDKHFLSLLNEYHFESVAPDQDYLNAICKDRILYLDEAWDVMPCEGHTPVQNAKIVHYNLFSKPWCYDEIPYGELFWKYVAKGGFEAEAKAHRRAYTNEHREADKLCLKRMLERAEEICRMSVTFRNIAEGGVQIAL